MEIKVVLIQASLRTCIFSSELYDLFLYLCRISTEYGRKERFHNILFRTSTGVSKIIYYFPFYYAIYFRTLYNRRNADYFFERRHLREEVRKETESEPCRSVDFSCLRFRHFDIVNFDSLVLSIEQAVFDGNLFSPQLFKGRKDESFS